MLNQQNSYLKKNNLFCSANANFLRWCRHNSMLKIKGEKKWKKPRYLIPKVTNNHHNLKCYHD